jgi:hypothetical protein
MMGGISCFSLLFGATIPDIRGLGKMSIMATIFRFWGLGKIVSTP